MSRAVIIVGAGAHARKVGLYASHIKLPVVAFADENANKPSPIQNVPLVPVECVHHRFGESEFLVAVGNPLARRRLQEKFVGLGWTPISLIHPTAYVAADVKMGAGVLVCAGAVIETGSVVGNGAIVDIGSLVDHDSVVTEYSHVRPGANLFANSLY